jgi:HAD superfamily hydrolase (TIGR01509 family)
MPAVEAIFWDNDGVLVDTEHLYFEATRDTLATAGIDLTPADYLQLFLVQGKGAWHLAEERGIPEVEVTRLKNARNDLYSQRLAERSRLIPGVADVLEGLRGRYVMGVVTSSRRHHFEVIHRHTEVLKYFDFVLTADDLARTKPDPEPYLRAVEKSGVAPEACIAIEDSERGLEAATLAGIRCIVVPTMLTRGCEFRGAHRILRGVGEIPGLLESL